MSKHQTKSAVKEINDLLAMTRQHAEGTVDELIVELRKLRKSFSKPKPQDGPPSNWEVHARLLGFLQHRIVNFEDVLGLVKNANEES